MNQIIEEDVFLQEGVEFTSSILSARKELNHIKHLNENTTYLSEGRFKVALVKESSLNSNFSQETLNCANSYTTNNCDREVLAPKSESLEDSSGLSDEESDVYEVPMSSPDSVSYVSKCSYLNVLKKKILKSQDFT